MKILNLRTIEGPSVYHQLPVLILKIDLQEWVDRSSRSIPGFTDQLLGLFPGLRGHHCSRGHTGGFVERLEEGTYLAHVIEHVALELSHEAGIGVNYGKSRYCGNTSEYEVAVRFVNEEGMKKCLLGAYAKVRSLIGIEVIEMNPSGWIESIKLCVAETKLGPTTKAIHEAALARGIPCRHLGSSLLQLGYGKYQRLIQAAVTDQTSLIAADLVQDKDLTKKFLSENMIPVPRGEVVSDIDQLDAVLATLQSPYVVKPIDGHHGQGVCLNLYSKEEVIRAFQIAQHFGPLVLVEEMCAGKDYRILVVGGKFTAAAERKPPTVTGDGVLTVQNLIDQMNRDPLRSEGHSGTLTKIEVNDSLLEALGKQNLNLTEVLENGTSVHLRDNANLSSGGTAKDVTDETHPQIRRMCERIARLVNLDLCGVDIIASDLAAPLDESLKVIEVNAAPGLRMHLQPNEGVSRPVGNAIIDLLFPEGSPSRVPIVSVTGTNGKTTVVRLIRRILMIDPNRNVGMTTTDGIWIGEELIHEGDTTGPCSSRTILSDRSVDVAVLETARGGLLRGGLGYDWSDVGLITNIRPDHIGQDGIENMEDLVWVKSLVAERIKPGGILILNADDEESSRLVLNAKVRSNGLRVVMYSTCGHNPKIISHFESGGEVYFCEGGSLYRSFAAESETVSHLGSVSDSGSVSGLGSTSDSRSASGSRAASKLRDSRKKVIEVQALNFTLQGKAEFQVSNALGAIAASFALGATLEQIQKGLMQFNPVLENRGRANLYQVGQGYLFLDYGHNPDALTAVGHMMHDWKCSRKTAVFGLPGDRPDDLLATSAAQVASIFDRVVLRDDFDLRGRVSGEVPHLLQDVMRTLRPDVQLTITLNELEAVRKALSEIQKDEIVAVFYDELEPVMRVIEQFHPVPATQLPDFMSMNSGSLRFRNGRDGIGSESEKAGLEGKPERLLFDPHFKAAPFQAVPGERI